MHCPSLRLSLCAACLLAALALCLPAPAQAATLTVPAQYPTIRLPSPPPRRATRC